jgi:hypothetical protein
MRIFELSRPDVQEDVAPILARGGWSIYGEGYYAQVYGRDDKDYVLKVFDYRDRGYAEFLKLVATNANPHFPKIIGKPIKITSGYWAVRMEKLTPAPEALQIGIYLSTRDNGPNPRNSLQIAAHEQIMELFESQPLLKDALDLIIDNILHNSSIGADLHKENVMKRSDGTLVIIDPVN